MPGAIDCEALPLRLTAEGVPVTAGTGRLANGSPRDADPVEGVTEKVALPLERALPATWMLGADTRAFPVAVMAEGEVEATYSEPVICRWALPDRLRAPAEDVLRT